MMLRRDPFGPAMNWAREAREDAALSHESLERPALDDAPFVGHQNAIGVLKSIGRCNT